MRTISETKSFRSFGWMVAALLLCLTVLGRLLGCFYSITATDVLYDAWMSTAVGYVMDGLSCLRYVLGFGIVLYTQRKWGISAGNGMFVIVNICNLADIGTRFVIDWFSGNIIGLEVLALMWLLLEFVYEMIILALCWVTGRMFILRSGISDSVRRTRRYSMARAFWFSLLYVLILQIGMWLYDAIDFLHSYSQIRNYEYASMAGEFIYVLVLYGGVAFLCSELVQWFLGRTYGKTEE